MYASEQYLRWKGRKVGTKNKDFIIFLSEDNGEVFILNNGQIEKVNKEIFDEEYCFFKKRTFYLSKKFLFEYYNELSQYQKDLVSANSLLNELYDTKTFEEYKELEIETLYSNDKKEKAFIFDKDDKNISSIELYSCEEKTIEEFKKQYNKKLSTKEEFYFGIICGQLGVQEAIKLLNSFEEILNKEISILFCIAIMRIIAQKNHLTGSDRCVILCLSNGNNLCKKELY